MKDLFRYTIVCPINRYRIYVEVDPKGNWHDWYWEPEGFRKAHPDTHYSGPYKTPKEAFDALAEFDCEEFEIK